MSFLSLLTDLINDLYFSVWAVCYASDALVGDLALYLILLLLLFPLALVTGYFWKLKLCGLITVKLLADFGRFLGMDKTLPRSYNFLTCLITLGMDCSALYIIEFLCCPPPNLESNVIITLLFSGVRVLPLTTSY